MNVVGLLFPLSWKKESRLDLGFIISEFFFKLFERLFCYIILSLSLFINYLQSLSEIVLESEHYGFVLFFLLCS